MPLFCKSCDNLLKKITSSDNFYYLCEKCKDRYEPESADTIFYEETKESNLSAYQAIIRHIANDPVNPKVRIKCPAKGCKSNIAKQVRLGREMKLINGCVECGHKWVD